MSDLYAELTELRKGIRFQDGVNDLQVCYLSRELLEIETLFHGEHNYFALTMNEAQDLTNWLTRAIEHAQYEIVNEEAE